MRKRIIKVMIVVAVLLAVSGVIVHLWPQTTMVAQECRRRE